MPPTTFKTPEQVEFAELFEKLKLKAVQVAAITGVSESAISMYRSGDSNPSERKA